jgi:hypothetical protein
LGVVTVTSTVPLPGGEVAVIEVEEFTVSLVAATVPKSTVDPLVKLVPVIVTLVPPAAGPLLGRMPVTVGNTVVSGVDATNTIPARDPINELFGIFHVTVAIPAVVDVSKTVAVPVALVIADVALSVPNEVSKATGWFAIGVLF